MTDEIRLPDANTDEGAVARLSLAEARGPAYSDYDEAESRSCVERFKLVISNRLTNNPAQFGAPRAKNLRDIIKAPGQFAGFQDYPDLDGTVSARIQTFIDIANKKSDSRQEKYKTFVSAAIDVAGAPAVADPSPTGLYGWRTKGSGSPGPRFKQFDEVGGISFYTLKPASLLIADTSLTGPDRVDSLMSAVPRMIEDIRSIEGCFPDGIRSLSVRVVDPSGARVEIHLNRAKVSLE